MNKRGKKTEGRKVKKTEGLLVEQLQNRDELGEWENINDVVDPCQRGKSGKVDEK